MLSDRGWGVDGYLTWVKDLSDDYKRARDHFMKVFEAEVGDSGLATADCPTSGMFVWIKVNVHKHPRYQCSDSPLSPTARRTNTTGLMEELFKKLFDEGVVLIPASYFAIPNSNPSSKLVDEEAIEDVSFSFSSQLVFNHTD
jgi:aromatic amino acid aminotransferase I